MKTTVLLIVLLSSLVGIYGSDITAVNITGATKIHVVLNCTIEGASNPYQWKLDSKVLSNHVNSTLLINSSHSVGIYECRNGDANQSFNAINFTFPTIEHHGQSITVTEGEMNKELICHSNSYPHPTFTWRKLKDGETINLSTDESSEYSVTSNNTKSVLTIATVNFNSRANYECQSVNIAGNGTAKVLVRVEGKLAPLWPFLGIVAEVIIMIVITLVTTRKTKTG